MANVANELLQEKVSTELSPEYGAGSRNHSCVYAPVCGRNALRGISVVISQCIHA